MTPEVLKRLLEVNRLITSTLDVKALIRIIMEQVQTVANAEASSLMLLDEASQELVFDVALGAKGESVKSIRVKVGEGIAGAVARDRVPILVKDAASDPRWSRKADDKSGFKTRSILCVPLLAHGRLIGVMQALNRRDGRPFSEAGDLPALEAFAAQAAIAIENARLFESLREERDKLQAVFFGMGDGALILDPAMKAIFGNRAAARFLNLTIEHLPGLSLGEALTGFDLQPPVETLPDMPENSVPVEWTRRSGKSLILWGTATRISDEQGRPVGWLIVFRDVTESARENLMKRNFISLISHKLKTPLVAITGYTPLLLEEGGKDPLTPFQRKAIQAIDQQGRNLAGLVEKLLLYTHTEATARDLARKAVPPAQLIARALEKLSGMIQEQHATVRVEPSVEKLPPVWVDEEKAALIFINLVENAVKFSRDDRRVEIGGGSSADGVSIWVRDHGPGIPGEEFERIFDRFYQVEESFTGQIEGAGLGLALVKSLVSAHGGTVTVSSTLGHGSRFSVTLPVASLP